MAYPSHTVPVAESLQMDGEPLMSSPRLSDNVLAVLTRLGSRPGTVRRILERIAKGPVAERGGALTELSILAGLRKLNGEVKRETRKMPILEDIMNNEIFGPAIRQGLKQGRVEGRQEGRHEGRLEGQRDILLRQIERRFGKVLPTVRKRLAAFTSDQLEAVGLRLLDAGRVEDLFER